MAGLLAHGVDQTERKLAEVKLFESRERFAKIVGQAATGVVEMDQQGRITLVNQKYCDMLGYTEAELSAVPDGANLGLGCGNPQALDKFELLPNATGMREITSPRAGLRIFSAMVSHFSIRGARDQMLSTSEMRSSSPWRCSSIGMR